MNVTFDLDLSGDFFFLLIHYKNDSHSVSGSFSGAGATAVYSFMTKVPIKLKPIHWFAEQNSGLVSVW